MDASVAADRLVECESAAFADGFAHQPVVVRHRVSGHQLVALDAIASLADDLPAAWATVMPADVPILHPAAVRTVDTPAGDVLRTLDSADLRVTLYHLELLTGYRALLEACLAPFSAVVTGREGPPTASSAFIFAASPRSTIPTHIDSHHNLLLQLEGTKTLTVGWFADPVDQARAVELRYRGPRPNPDRMPTVTRTFRLGPGDGVYIPSYAFHWVQAGDRVSVALSCGFSTVVTERAELVHRMNTKLRRLGVRPRPPGPSPRRDRAKAAAFVQGRRLRAAAVSAARRQPVKSGPR